MEPITRPSLIARLKDAAAIEAWREFDRVYGDLILRYARRRGLQHADAEDVRQIVSLAMSQALRNFSYEPGRGRFRGYLARAVHNAVHRLPEWRERQLPPDLHALFAEPAQGPGYDALFEREWLDHHLRAAVTELRATSGARDVHLFERLFHGASTAAVAAELGLSEANVHKIKQRVRARLGRIVARRLAEEGLAGP